MSGKYTPGTTSGLDQAMQAHADQMHPVSRPGNDSTLAAKRQAVVDANKSGNAGKIASTSRDFQDYVSANNTVPNGAARSGPSIVDGWKAIAGIPQAFGKITKAISGR